MPPEGVRDGRFTMRPCEARTLDGTGPSAMGDNWPATVLMIWASDSSRGPQRESSGRSAPGKRVTPACRARCLQAVSERGVS